MNSVFAQSLIDSGTCPEGVTPPCPANIQSLETVFANVLAAAIPFAGIVLFVVLLLAGFSWVTAGSDTKKAEGARNMATYGVIGIVVLAVSFLILRLLATFTGVDSILFFKITQ